MPLIALDRLNVHLAGRHVLRDVSWRLESGEHWAVVGGNGSGKTTLLRVIRGDQWPDPEGGGSRIYALDGIEQSVASAARRIGYVSPELHERIARLELPVNGRALVASGLHDTFYAHGPLSDADAQAVDALLERFGLQALAARRVDALSHGELRRLLVARALVSSPRVLVLDEFLNGVDREARAALLTFVERAAAVTQVVCASHRPDDLPETIGRYARLAHGRIVESGDGAPPRHHRVPPAAPAAGGVSPDLLLEIADADVYRGRTLVLREIAFTLRRGEHTVIRGANGAGKSTLAGLLAGTIPAAYGARIVRFGETGPFSRSELSRRVVHVSDALQIAYDRDPSVEGVIASGFAASIGLYQKPGPEERERVAELMERLGLQPLAGRRFQTLSFGERRKVLIARGLVHRPEVLIFDEIWSGLDASFSDALHALLDELAAAGTTLVLVSHHDDDLPPFARRTFTIADGRLVPTASAFRAAP